MWGSGWKGCAMIRRERGAGGVSGRTLLPLVLSALFLFFPPSAGTEGGFRIHLAVEYTDHAASAYVARHKGWFDQEGLNPTFYSYVTGMNLASALGRGDIQAAYICLLPAVNAYANAKVPLKIVAGTHKHGYGLAADPRKVRTVKDLENPDVRIGGNQAGGPADAILYRTIEKYGLDRNTILRKVQRMNPAKGIMAVRMGKLDALFNCEHWPTMAEEAGFRMLLTSRDLWPEMQGSVLIVKEELIRDHPDVVRKLVNITRKSIRWIRQNPEEAARVMSLQLQITADGRFPSEAPTEADNLAVTPEVILRSMARMEHSIEVDPAQVQKAIDFAAEHEYIRKRFPAREILDLRFTR